MKTKLHAKWSVMAGVWLLACSAGDTRGAGTRVAEGTGDGSSGGPLLPPELDGREPGSSAGGPSGAPNDGLVDFGEMGVFPEGFDFDQGTPGSGCPTTISGVTYDPAGRLPLYNVVVYVPSEPLSPIVRGAACETCDGNFSGRPLAAAVSDATGAFTLDITGVPTRTSVPLVIQAGKWRRQVTLPAATDCSDTRLDPDLSRLPRNRAEGNLPRVAVMRGGSDALGCLFAKIGVDPAEFAPGGGDGSIELYFSSEANATPETGQMTRAGANVALPAVDGLFSNLDTLLSYDMVVMSCEGGDERYDPPNLVHRENLQQYANLGGRLFGGHYHNGIIDNRELPDDYQPFPQVVSFSSGRQDITPQEFSATVNVGFDKGLALADWLVTVGASTTHGSLQINDSERTVIDTLHPDAVSWIDTTFSGANASLYYGFPTPVDGPACGRMVFTDVHLASGSGDSGKEAFPSCSDQLSPQQMALAFLIFDLANCVQTNDTEPPPRPTIY